MDSSIEKYLEKKGLFQPINIYKNYDSFYENQNIAIVIPLYMEYPDFYQTLSSLKTSIDCITEKKTFRIICVVNNKKEDSATVKENNQKTIKMLKNQDLEFPIAQNLYIDVLDCSSIGFEIPSNQGVGYCRKIGMDYAVKTGSKLIACLDGDTLVSKNYCSVLLDFACKKNPYAALIPFKHQQSEDIEQQKAIKVYEAFMHKHSNNLQKTGTIYYQIALGPTIVCSSKAYIAVGGMNQKLAAEDFYFLQSLVKNKASTLDVLDCFVYPSARISYRVPFGTGQAISSLCQKSLNSKEELYKTGYPLLAYNIISDFIQSMKHCCKTRVFGDDLIAFLKETVPEIHPFLQDENFYNIWKKLLLNNKKTENLERAFQCWFDGLKIIRLIHFVEETINPERQN